MGVYGNFMLPHLVHRAMRASRLAPLRQRIVSAASGRVLEIGIGSGLNLAYYSRNVTELVGMDPAARLLGMARKSAVWMPFKVSLLCQSAEHIPADDESFDTIVVTWTLCSIGDVSTALREMHRVLRPQGQMLFVEHGRAPEGPAARWQDRLTPLWRLCSGNCHLNRRPDLLIGEAGFEIPQLEAGPLVQAGPLFSHHFAGRAVRP